MGGWGKRKVCTEFEGMRGGGVKGRSVQGLTGWVGGVKGRSNQGLEGGVLESEESGEDEDQNLRLSPASLMIQPWRACPEPL